MHIPNKHQKAYSYKYTQFDTNIWNLKSINSVLGCWLINLYFKCSNVFTLNKPKLDFYRIYFYRIPMDNNLNNNNNNN